MFERMGKTSRAKSIAEDSNERKCDSKIRTGRMAMPKQGMTAPRGSLLLVTCMMKSKKVNGVNLQQTIFQNIKDGTLFSYLKDTKIKKKF